MSILGKLSKLGRKNKRYWEANISENQLTSMEELSKSMADLTCRLSKVCTEKDSYLAARFNLTPAEFRCLKLFIKSSEISIKVLGKELSLSPGRITHILTSLEAKGYITRNANQADKRNVIVKTTDKSIPFVNNLHECYLQVHNEILKIIDPSQRECVISSMEALVNAINEWSREKRLPL